VDGASVTGTIATQTLSAAATTVSAGYYNGTDLATVDADLATTNIKSGATVFGVTGTSVQSDGTATPDQVLQDQTFSNASGPATGTMPNVGKQDTTPSTTDQSIDMGYHDGTGVVAGDVDLVSDNIHKGKTVFGVAGNSHVVNTSTGDAVAGEILSGKKAWVGGNEVTGNIPTQTLSNATTTVSAGYYANDDLATVDTDLVSGNIHKGKTVFGVAGNSNVVNTSTGDAGAGEILSGKKAWVGGNEVTGNIPTQTLSNTTTAVSAGHYIATDLATVDTDLVSASICSGVSIFGITGRAICTTVKSATGRVWMDRNLGASQVATSSNDSAAYGDLYQWGRLSDGHENRTSPTTFTNSTTDVPGHDSFIFERDVPYDWRTPKNDNLWQGESGTNNPCPSGFRLPTDAEWQTEKDSWGVDPTAADAFASPLKLVKAGTRHHGDGSVSSINGNYWSSSVNSDLSRYLFFTNSFVSVSGGYRATGMSVRCIQD
jgi:uncharacterized protein (TIGR02145 family)